MGMILSGEVVVAEFVGWRGTDGIFQLLHGSFSPA
jgi:hypothetical protein